jgi:aminopeptidase N
MSRGAVALCSVIAASCGRDRPADPAYHLRVRVEPDGGTLTAVADIENPTDSIFTLTGDMELQRLVADGTPVHFRRVLVDSASSTTEVTLTSGIPHRLVVEYAGRFNESSYPPIVSQVTMVRAGLVELASYAGWYPRFKNRPSFDFRVDVDVPSPYVTLTNGVLTRKASHDGRTLTTWESTGPTGDIALISAPRLRKRTVTHGDLTLEIYHDQLPDAYVDSMIGQLAASVDLLTGWFGAPSSAHLVRIAYAPRAGWGYVRVPLIIVSERYALAQHAQPFGPARDFKYLAHEIAHYWWHTADASTPDDWINEGLAEFSSLLVSERIIGTAFADQLVTEYRDRAAHSITDTPITETSGGSPDRETNRYAKPVLLLQELRQQYGDTALTRFLRAAYARFRSSGRATTQSFLQVLEQQLGGAAKGTFERGLQRRAWLTPTTTNDTNSYADTTFFGTWTGTLSQMGTDYQVILQLTSAGGNLLPAEGQRDTLRLTAVRATADSLIWKIGAYGIEYAGVLDRGSMTISGQWRQGGVPYPLDLSRR